MRIVLGLIGGAQKHQRDRAADTVALVVTDHAMIRYIERYTDIDLEEIEERIRDMIAADRKELAIRDRVLVTILPPGETAVDLVRGWETFPDGS